MKQNISSLIKGILCCVIFTGTLALASSLKYLFPPQYERYSYGIIGTLVAFVIVWLFTRLDKKQLGFYDLRWSSTSLLNFFSGFIVGILLSIMMLAAVVYGNGLSIEPVPGYDVVLFFAWGMSLLLLSFMEEVAFRTYAFVTIKNVAGAWAAQIIIAILFALYHVAGGQSMASAFMGPFIWSFIFGSAVLRTNGIAMATGIHFAANILQAAFGLKAGYPSIWRINTDGVTNANQQSIEQTGLIVHLILLIIGTGLTIFVTRQKRLNLIV